MKTVMRKDAAGLVAEVIHESARDYDRDVVGGVAALITGAEVELAGGLDVVVAELERACSGYTHPGASLIGLYEFRGRDRYGRRWSVHVEID